MGDPAGISPELTARVLSLGDVLAAARIVVVGDRRVLEEGAKVANVALDVEWTNVEWTNAEWTNAEWTNAEWTNDMGGLDDYTRPLFIDLGHLDPTGVERAVATRSGGEFALRNYRTCLELAKAGRADAVAFTPFNKSAMRAAHPGYDDEIGYSLDVLGLRGPASEFNILEGLWNARVTSHMPLADVASHISREGVLAAIRLTDRSLRNADVAVPRIAVAALNPHAGDGGNFGREEIDVIRPAVEAARSEGIAVEGPYPSDTVFVRARAGAFDAVVTMYHDQGQIAMKLMGFDRGVTLMGGFPFPICTPAHGTAYEIAGKGIANIGATRAALLLAARMAARQRQSDRAASAA